METGEGTGVVSGRVRKSNRDIVGSRTPGGGGHLNGGRDSRLVVVSKGPGSIDHGNKVLL